jgi:hypothetical protein
MGSLPEKPKTGVMIVHPRAKAPVPENLETFRKWSRIHFRDLLQARDITHATRFVAPPEDDKFSHTDNSKLGPLLYTWGLDDISVIQGNDYFAPPRQLDLENTRKLVDGEEPVERQGSVFDVVDAGFAVYEECKNEGISTLCSSSIMNVCE